MIFQQQKVGFNKTSGSKKPTKVNSRTASPKWFCLFKVLANRVSNGNVLELNRTSGASSP